jgi:hypothetical protein
MAYTNEFEVFLKKILNLTTHIKNDITIVLWNMCKTYLSLLLFWFFLMENNYEKISFPNTEFAEYLT